MGTSTKFSPTRFLVFDLETGPDDSFLGRADVPDLIRSRIRVPGNYTKATSIEQYKQDAYAKTISKAALDPLLCRIRAWAMCVIDLGQGRGTQQMKITGAAEPERLSPERAQEFEAHLVWSFWEKALEIGGPNIIWCGHNIRQFDIPVLCARTAILRIKVPKQIFIPHTRSWDRVIDTFDWFPYESLGFLAARIVPSLEPRKTSGKESLDLYGEELYEHVVWDLHATASLICWNTFRNSYLHVEDNRSSVKVGDNPEEDEEKEEEEEILDGKHPRLMDDLLKSAFGEIMERAEADAPDPTERHADNQE